MGRFVEKICAVFFLALIGWLAQPVSSFAGGCRLGGGGISCATGAPSPVVDPSQDILPDALYNLGAELPSPTGGGNFLEKFKSSLSCPAGSCARIEPGSGAARSIAQIVRKAATNFGEKGIPRALKGIKDPKMKKFVYGLERDLHQVADVLEGARAGAGAGSRLAGGIEVVKPQGPEQTIFGEYSPRERKVTVYADPSFVEDPTNPKVIGTLVHEIGHAIYHERVVATGTLEPEMIASNTMLTEIVSHALQNVFGTSLQDPGVASGTEAALVSSPNLATYFAQRGASLSQEHTRYGKMFTRQIETGGYTQSETYGALGEWATTGAQKHFLPTARMPHAH